MHEGVDPMTSMSMIQFQSYQELDVYPQPHVIMKDDLIRKLISKTGLTRDMHFLDFGCGRGRILKMMADMGFWNGIGIDSQDICIDICRMKLKETGIGAINADLNDIQQSFDLIIMSSVLEHIQDDRACLRSVNDHLRKEGFFLFTVPGDMKLYGQRDIDYGHYRRYEKDELIEKMNESGFHILILWSYGMSILSKLYRILIKNELKQNASQAKEKASGQSAIHSAGFNKIKSLYPLYSKLMFM